MPYELNGQERASLNDKSENGAELFLLAKAKRIFAATNRISEYLEANEPIRLKLRDSACELLASTLSLIAIRGLKTEEVIKDIYWQSNRLLSYIDVLVMSGMLSETNREIIKDEILSFKIMADALANRGLGLVPIENLFGVMDSSAELFLPAQHPKVNSVSVEPSTDFERSRTAPSFQNEATENAQKDGRKKAIFDYIRKRGAATVRDLVPIIKGCSEKTIQRELAGLVGSGALRKEGDRRWSKYFLAHTL